jgi:hypothetical protein
MHIQVAPVLSAVGFVVGCALLRAGRPYARRVTPVLVAVALGLSALLLVVVSARTQAALCTVAADGTEQQPADAF